LLISLSVAHTFHGNLMLNWGNVQFHTPVQVPDHNTSWLQRVFTLSLQFRRARHSSNTCKIIITLFTCISHIFKSFSIRKTARIRDREENI